MSASIDFYKTEISFYSSKFNINKHVKRKSQYEFFSSDSVALKNAKTLPNWLESQPQNKEDKKTQIHTQISEELIQKIRQKSQVQNGRQNSSKIQPIRHKSFSSYINNMIEKRNNQRELKVYKSFTKNIKQMKVEKFKTQVKFYNNQKRGINEKSSKSRECKSREKYHKVDNYKGNLIILGIKEQRLAQLKAQEQKLNTSKTRDFSNLISAWNTKINPHKRTHTQICSKTQPNGWFNTLSDSQNFEQQGLVEFLNSGTVNIKKRQNFMKKKNFGRSLTD